MCVRSLCSLWRQSVRGFTTRALIYERNGTPHEVVRLGHLECPDSPASNEVHVKWLAAPINPADINQIEGVYPIQPRKPAVGGSEGYGRVHAIGADVQGLRPGDHVIPARSGLGTWRADAVLSARDVFKIDADLPPASSATFQVNPPTAYRMLEDFVKLKPGDTVIQNGSTSAVGRAVIQICKARGIKTINVVRKRATAEQQAALAQELRSIGGTDVLTEEELAKARPRDVPLALNCVGGRSALLLSATLGPNGVLVTYGAMSKQPLAVSAGALIFKDIALKGFWMSRWYEQPENCAERRDMYDKLAALIRTGQLHAPKTQKRTLQDHADALKAATSDYSQKQLFFPNE